MLQVIDFERMNMQRMPDWRYRRVLQLIANQPHPANTSRPAMAGQPGRPGRTVGRDDEYVRDLRKFMLRYQAAELAGDTWLMNQLAYSNAPLFFAWQNHVQRDGLSENDVITVEARLLTGLSDEAIAREYGTSPEVIEYYEALFFNVRDRLKQHDWILTRVLLPALDHSLGLPAARRTLSDPFGDVMLKFFAYYGGPFLLQTALTGFHRNILANPADAEAWYQKQHDMFLSRRMAQAMGTVELTRYNFTELCHVNMRLREIHKSNDSDASKRDQAYNCLASCLRELPWATGDEGETNISKTALVKYDRGAGELRDTEMLQVAAGESPAKLEEVEGLKMPPPRRLRELPIGTGGIPPVLPVSPPVSP